MKVLVVGSGAREHALAWRLASEDLDVLVSPGNGGTPNAAPIQATDVDGLTTLAEHERVDLTIVGPEAPLAAGIVDHFTQHGLAVFGPTRAAARLEWSKAWAKAFLVRHGIPTGRAEVVESEVAARRAIARSGAPVVLKADGLAGGKGVFVATTEADLEHAMHQLFRARVVESAADHVLVEEYLEGPELSVLAFVDGERLAMMPPARDYKRLLDGERGPNTGGMGGYTWPAYATRDLLAEIESTILRPTLRGMADEGETYRGVLYAGVIVTRAGPKVLEFNCRFGDPECQLILPLLRGRLIDVFDAVVQSRLDPNLLTWSDERTYGVVLAARGYPDAPVLGDTIQGLESVEDGVLAFHAGTRHAGEGLVTSGGRVLTVVGTERASVYRAVDLIRFEGKQFRRDIGVVDVPNVVGAHA
jgi:phosphoribosylamine---glycine ligase